MDLAQLVGDLSVGLRLIKPSLCPKPISDLIQICFDIDPDKRPDFKEIKQILQSAYKILFYGPCKNDKVSSVLDDDYIKLPSTSSYLPMKAQYHHLLKENMEKQKIENSPSTSEYVDFDISNNSYTSTEAVVHV